MEQETSWVGDQSRGWKSGWREKKMKPAGKEAAQKRKEQADGKRAARGRCPLEPHPNRGAEYLQKSDHSGGGGPGSDGGRRR